VNSLIVYRIAVFPILADLVKVKVKRRISLFVDNYNTFS